MGARPWASRSNGEADAKDEVVFGRLAAVGRERPASGAEFETSILDQRIPKRRSGSPPRWAEAQHRNTLRTPADSARRPAPLGNLEERGQVDVGIFDLLTRVDFAVGQVRRPDNHDNDRLSSDLAGESGKLILVSHRLSRRDIGVRDEVVTERDARSQRTPAVLFAGYERVASSRPGPARRRIQRFRDPALPRATLGRPPDRIALADKLTNVPQSERGAGAFVIGRSARSCDTRARMRKLGSTQQVEQARMLVARMFRAGLATGADRRNPRSRRGVTAWAAG